jgi:hypothetical protein
MEGDSCEWNFRTFDLVIIGDLKLDPQLSPYYSVVRPDEVNEKESVPNEFGIMLVLSR